MDGDAKRLKELLGVQAKDIISTGLSLRFRGKKAWCPVHEEKTPSMAWHDEGNIYKCFGCGATIDIFDYYKMQGLEFPEAVEEVKKLTGQVERVSVKPVKAYDKPSVATTELSAEAIAYMAKRKIKQETLEAWRVKEATFAGKQVYCFQYFEKEDAEPTYVTYRGIGKGGLKGGCEKNTKPILWGMWHIDKNKPVVITEGQPDAMAVWQAGYKNVISVPNGTNNFQWVSNCWDWLCEISEFIVWADNDQPGHKMAKEIQDRLRNVTIIHGEHKDANETLYYKGEVAVLAVIEEALNRTPPGILNLSNLEYETHLTERETIETGFREYDEYIEDWKMGELTVIFGRNNEGKTTVISQMIAHSIQDKNKVFLYSGEMSNQKIQDWLYRQIVGSWEENYRYIKTKYGNKAELKPEVVRRLKEWHDGHVYLFDRSRNDLKRTPEKFFDTMKLARRRYGIRLFVIDNLMAALEENADSLYSDQANFVQWCKDFAIDNDCHVVLVAHPNKEKKEINAADDVNLAKNDISGSGNIGNKADNIIAVQRLWDDENNDMVLSSLKDRTKGQRRHFLMNFDDMSGRFYSDKTPLNIKYGWNEGVATGFQCEVEEEAPEGW